MVVLDADEHYLIALENKLYCGSERKSFLVYKNMYVLRIKGRRTYKRSNSWSQLGAYVFARTSSSVYNTQNIRKESKREIRKLG